ncbi:MAG: GNAT family N-acetyltransferase [Candidatus Andersenbacteria bacterium]|nr:GNAT family N-acetyltransferase [Candidatus Andersenbacteria bacterium]MBI3251109.1 GNAT family N-acetyltransferase [Candidatus Andersenbacteria bacterium]
MLSTEVREVSGEEERQAMFRLRYDTYCTQLGWINPELCPNGQESDEYDPVSLHFIALEEGRVAGTIRLIRQSSLPFPLETAFPKPQAEDLEVVSMEGVVAGEVSRLIVSPRNGSPSHALCLGLIQALFRKSLHESVTHWLQAIDTKSHRVVRSLGFRLRQYAPALHFMGSDSLPTTLKLSRCLDDFRQHNPRTFEFFSQDVDPREIVSMAASVVGS